MILKQCDLLSPPITLYFKGYSIHPTIFAGILTIASYLLIFISIIYYSINYIYKVNPNIYFYTRYIENAGIFPLNSSSLFHFIKLTNSMENEEKSIDYKSIRIFGFENIVDNYISNNNLSSYDHWLYGPCIDDDINGIENFTKTEINENSACIRKYYDSGKNQYFNTNEKNFKWPSLLYGASNKNSTNYGIIMEKCTNDSLNKNCKSENEIEKYLKHLYASLYFMDQYVDALNYETPFIKYLYKLSNLFFNNSFTVNHLNFNPSHVASHSGIIVDELILDKSYQYTQNEKVTMEIINTKILISFHFWMQNTMQYYERKYEKFQDLISNIGGINSSITLVAIIINYVISNYIILLDTEALVLNSDKQNFKSYKFNLKPAILKKASQIMNPPKFKSLKSRKHVSFKKKQSSIYQILLNNKTNIAKLNNVNFKTDQEAKSEPFNLYTKRTNKFNIISEGDEIEKKNNQSLSFNRYYKIEKCTVKSSSIDSNSLTLRDSVHELGFDNKEKKYKPIVKQNFTFMQYIYFVICCKRKNPKMNYYEIFRTQVISEENLIQNHFNIFKLLSLCKIENLNPFEIKTIETCC